MALGHTFYHATIKKMVVVFGNLFNDIYIRKFDASGAEINRIKVPISYGPKQKFLARLDAGGNDQLNAITLPRMAFEMDSLTYDAERKLNSLNTISYQGSSGELKYTYAPVPYSFEFSLYIMVKSADDGTQILEQILPYFTPHFNVSVKEFPDLDVVKDIPVILQGLQQEDIYDGDFEARRSIVWTLTFTMKGNMYGSVRDGKIIQSTSVSAFKQNDDNTFVQDTEVEQTVNDPDGLVSEDFGFTEARNAGETP